MATSVVPALIDALVAGAAAAMPAVNVLDGMGATDDPGEFLMIGVEDPDVDGYAASASTQQEWANANYTSRDESGEIRCLALAWNGDGDPKAARDAAYGITGQVEDLLRTTPALGLDNLLWTSFGQSTELNQVADSSGALAFVLFTIYFRARI